MVYYTFASTGLLLSMKRCKKYSLNYFLFILAKSYTNQYKLMLKLNTWCLILLLSVNHRLLPYVVRLGVNLLRSLPGNHLPLGIPPLNKIYKPTRKHIANMPIRLFSSINIHSPVLCISHSFLTSVFLTLSDLVLPNNSLSVFISFFIASLRFFQC